MEEDEKTNGPTVAPTDLQIIQDNMNQEIFDHKAGKLDFRRLKTTKFRDCR